MKCILRARLLSVRPEVSADQARPFVVEFPAWNQRLHRHRIVARAQSVLLVKLIGLGDLIHVDIDAQAALFRHGDAASDDL